MPLAGKGSAGECQALPLAKAAIPRGGCQPDPHHSPTFAASAILHQIRLAWLGLAGGYLATPNSNWNDSFSSISLVLNAFAIPNVIGPMAVSQVIPKPTE